MGAWSAFSGDTLTIDLPEERLHAAGNKLFLIPEHAITTSGLHLVRYGLRLGESRKGHFRPHPDLALALNQYDVTRAAVWQAADPQLAAYQAGEDMADAGPTGWVLATVEGCGLGWARRSDGRLKNHYPHAQRRRPRSE